MIREISSEKIVETVAELFREACVCPPKEVIDAFAAAKETEVSQQGREIFCQLIENAAIANETKVPYCQDTGMAVVLMDIGQDVHITGDLTDAVNEGVRKAYTEGYFRKSVLSALGRVNTGDNTPAVLHTRIVPGDKIEITALPKGFGSENM
ncbi:MAG: fumarate hydratase, partial [Christensenellaceae bacterium]|nr:fumarate hydratase [Christensenellaceae bacterium]